MTLNKLNGTLLLDLATIETGPVFFALQALLFRSAGLEVHVAELADGRHETGYRSAKLGVGFNEAVHYTSKDDPRKFKFEYALARLKHGPVFWPDNFDNWAAGKLGDVNKVDGLIILNWAKCLRDGVPVDLKGGPKA